VEAANGHKRGKRVARKPKPDKPKPTATATTGLTQGCRSLHAGSQKALGSTGDAIPL